MTLRKRECAWCYNELSADKGCNWCGIPQPDPDANCITTPDGGCIGGTLIGKHPCTHDLPKRYMMLQLHFDAESFNEFKELLRIAIINNLGRTSLEEPHSARRRREALERVFKQIRDVEYHDG